MKALVMNAREMNALGMRVLGMRALGVTEVLSLRRFVDLIVEESMILFLSVWGTVDNVLVFPRGKGSGSLQTLAST